jgi:WD40 repeat protein
MHIKDPAPIWRLSFEGDWPTSVTFLADGRHLAAANRGGQIYLWELPEQAPEPEEVKDGKKDKQPPDFAPSKRLDGHENGVTHLLATPDGKTLVSSSLDRSVRIWDPAAAAHGQAEVVLDRKLREQRARRKPKQEKEEILNAPGITVNTLAATDVLEGHKGWVLGLGLSADGRRLISGDDTCLSIVWDLKSRQPVSQWRGYDRVWVRSAALSPDGKRAFTAEFADRRSNFDVPAPQARFWDCENGEMALDLLRVWTPKVKDKDRVDSYGYRSVWSKLIKRGLVCAAFSPSGSLLAVGQGGETDTGKVHLVDVQSGEIVRTVSGHRYGVCDVKFSADGKYVLSSGRDTMVRICQVSDGKEVAALGESRGGQFKDWMHAIAISPDQSKIAAADIAGMIHIWQLAPAP